MFLLSVFLLIFAIGGYNRYRNIFAPAVISPASWGILLLLYLLLDHRMENVSDKGICVIAWWNFCMIMGIYFFSEVNLKKSTEKIHLSFNPWIRKLYFWISIFGMIPMCYIAYKQGSLGEGSFLFNLRMANTGLIETEYSYGIWEYVFPFVFISYLIELMFYRKGNSSVRLRVMLILNIILMIITMAKSNIFFTIIASCVVIEFKQRMSFRFLFSICLVLVLGMSSFQLFRASEENTHKVISNMFYIYVFAGIPALDQIVNSEMTSSKSGQYVFSLYYNAKAKWMGEKRPKKENKNDITHEGYLYVPLPTNVYTMIAPFWLDYGWFGVSVFGFIIGSMAGVFFRLANKGILWAIIIYAYIACVLALQFFGEYIFNNFSYLIQLVSLSIIAYNFNYIVKWRKSTYCLLPSRANSI